MQKCLITQMDSCLQNKTRVIKQWESKRMREQCSPTPSANVRQPLAVLAHVKVPTNLMYPNNRRHEHGKVILILLGFTQSFVQCCNVYSSEDTLTKTSYVPRLSIYSFPFITENHIVHESILILWRLRLDDYSTTKLSSQSSSTTWCGDWDRRETGLQQ